VEVEGINKIEIDLEGVATGSLGSNESDIVSGGLFVT